MNYHELLTHSYEMAKLNECPPDTPCAFLSEALFDFTTYDGGMDELFGRKAVEVCAAINNRTTFEYIADPENYRWFLVMCNMPFFEGRLNWGTSIRGAWWDIPRGAKGHEINSCGLWVDGEQLLALHLSAAEWRLFMEAVVQFADIPQA